MLDWLFKSDPKKTIVKKAVRRAKKLLRSRQAPGLNAKIDYLFWYGAVEIDPKRVIPCGDRPRMVASGMGPPRQYKWEVY